MKSQVNKMIEFDSSYNNYSNKKGIYKDLYKAIDAEQKKKDTFASFRPRKGIYRDLYRHIEEEKALPKKSTNINKCFKNFGEGFVSSVKSIFETPRDFVVGMALVVIEWLLSAKQHLHTFAKLGKIAAVAQLGFSANEIRHENPEESCYYAGSGLSSFGFSNKYTGLLNCLSVIKTLIKDDDGR